MTPKFWASTWMLVLSASLPAHASAVGSPAPAVEPTEWLNSPPGTSWQGLKGRLVLVEKWATW
jgi:hypothetical protein